MAKGVAAREAHRCGLTVEMLRKARDAGREYDESALHALCVAAERADYALGVSHLIRFATLSRGRAAFQRKAVKGRWSKRRIDIEIRKLLGNRRPLAGRARSRPPRVRDVHYAVARFWQQWVWLLEALQRPAGVTKRRWVRHDPTNPAETLRKDVPKDLRDCLVQATRALRTLEQVATARLGKRAGSRAAG
jgi:hypothetical protein